MPVRELVVEAGVDWAGVEGALMAEEEKGGNVRPCLCSSCMMVVGCVWRGQAGGRVGGVWSQSKT